MAYIINNHGVFHDIPDDHPLPVGARKATAAEVIAWQTQDVVNKAALRAVKIEAAKRAAQLVVIGAPVEDAEPEQETKGKGKANAAKPTD